MFFDKVKIQVYGGKCGFNKICTFKKNINKYIKYGGNGGSVYISSDKNLNSLKSYYFKKKYFAKNGSNGNCSLKSSKSGLNIILKVPLNTFVRDLDKNKIILNLINSKLYYLLVSGKKNKFNNLSIKKFKFKNYKKKSYFFRNLELEFSIFSDVSLLGMPNVGKSSFLNLISGSKFNVNNFFFTTTNFNYIKIFLKKKFFFFLDVPGIIRNSYYGNGLGIKFLKHLINSFLILFFVDISLLNFNFLNFFFNIKIVNLEIYKYNKIIFFKSRWIVFNKIDLINFNCYLLIKKFLVNLKWYNKVFFISNFFKKNCFYLCLKFLSFRKIRY